MHSPPLSCLLAVLLLWGSGHALAADENPDRIRAAAEAVVRAQARGLGKTFVQADALDPRLRLPGCARPLEATIGGDGTLRARMPVGVRCSDARGWSIYLIVRIESEVPVLIAQRALPRDALPRVADFTIETRRVPGISTQFVTSTSTLEGRQLRRPVRAGEALASDALAIAPLVRRGEEVIVLAHAGGMEVRATGVALSDGRPEERIRVQNRSSQRVIEGVVRATGLVEVPL
jgi:flagella basal body P-ring formation protein FlgA